MILNILRNKERAILGSAGSMMGLYLCFFQKYNHLHICKKEIQRLE